MSRSSRRAAAAAAAAEAARKKNSPAEDFVRTAADRVGPLAQSAAGRVAPLVVAAADAIGSAADKVSPLAHSAADRVGPLAYSAADRVGPLAQTAADRIGPLAGSAIGRVTPYAQSAAGRAAPLAQTATGYAQSAVDRVAPFASSARQRGSQVTADTVRRFGPVLDDAVVRVTPAVTAVRGKVTDDLLPKLSGVLGTASARSVVDAISEAQAKDEAVLVVPTKRRGRWVKRILVIGAVGAAVAMAVRKYFGSQDADWQAARPSTPYVPPPAPAPSTSTDGATGVAGDSSPDEAPETVETVEEDFAATEPAPVEREAAPVGLLSVNDGGDIEETVVDEVVISEPVAELPEGEPVIESTQEADAPDGPGPRWSGAGVYVGTEPPEGFVIKGNERSMKYHVPEAAGYGRTVAEVWFNSEEAAQEAGFVRAQR